ncbi:hypothetical protein WR25_06401 isoform C [Diploscapter pachys]|uniref:BTB domain-containing protein n=3 Tax=Diploscapter pachys TaxID=2018661 RepID=A0A2A2LYU0_9BILA|nr:hypothetical protein WR25_06401 isoform C [Diploscapter pachys]
MSDSASLSDYLRAPDVTHGILEMGLDGEIVGEVEHVEELAADIGKLLMNKDYSDVTFIVDGEQFPAHRVILAARSEYFRALLYGGMRESVEEKISLPSANLKAFKLILRYAYTGQLLFTAIKLDLLLEVLTLANQYGFNALQNSIADYLKSILDTKNLCTVFNISQLFSLRDLAEYCLVYADRYADEILKEPTFLLLPVHAVKQLIKRDTFCAPEVNIFETIREWGEAHKDTAGVMHQLLPEIRLPLISQKDLLSIVRPSGLISSDVLLDTIDFKSKSKSTEFIHRGFQSPDINIATSQLGAVVISGETAPGQGLNLLSAESSSNENIPRTQIGDPEGIVVQLGNPYLINKIILILYERDNRNMAYSIEASIDKVDWAKVIDHSKYMCRRRQVLLFKPRAVRYIRVLGHANTAQSRYFHLSHLEAMYSTEKFQHDSDTTLQIPTCNVATKTYDAQVVDGVSRIRDALINGQTSGYDWDNGYTCHQLGNGSIVVQLNQPYLISSMRILLWDLDDRFYSYYIEVSNDGVNYSMIVDRRRYRCRSWQLLQFDPVPILFIRITGTHNSSNEVLQGVV